MRSRCAARVALRIGVVLRHSDGDVHARRRCRCCLRLVISRSSTAGCGLGLPLLDKGYERLPFGRLGVQVARHPAARQVGRAASGPSILRPHLPSHGGCHDTAPASAFRAGFGR
jgi:hypothetical protein